MQDKIVKHLFTLFFAIALLLATEGIMISRGEKNVQGEKQEQVKHTQENQLKRLQGEQPVIQKQKNKR